MDRLKMRVGVIGTVGIPAKYGGFETLAQQLSLKLKGEYEMTVYCSSKNYAPSERRKTWNDIRLVYLPLSANGAASVLYDILSMLHAMLFMDVLLILGVSGCIFLPVLKVLAPRKQVVVNLDGLEWRRAKWQGFAKHFLKFSERVAVRFANEVITDNAANQRYVEIHYGVSSRLIEYGADHAEAVEIEPTLVRKYQFLAESYAFKVCRIEPENNIHLVLEAFARFGGMPLVLVGNWNHSEYGSSLRELYRQYPNLYLLDPIYEPFELNMLRSNCALYVHAHSAGGTNPSLVEAMYLGLPVLACGAIYNRITTQNRAIYFQTAEDIIEVLRQLAHIDLKQIAHDMKWIADMRYNWSIITKKYSNALRGIEREMATTLEAEVALMLERAA